MKSMSFEYFSPIFYCKPFYFCKLTRAAPQKVHSFILNIFEAVFAETILLLQIEMDDLLKEYICPNIFAAVFRRFTFVNPQTRLRRNYILI